MFSTSSSENNVRFPRSSLLIENSESIAWPTGISTELWGCIGYTSLWIINVMQDESVLFNNLFPSCSNHPVHQVPICVLPEGSIGSVVLRLPRVVDVQVIPHGWEEGFQKYVSDLMNNSNVWGSSLLRRPAPSTVTLNFSWAGLRQFSREERQSLVAAALGPVPCWRLLIVGAPFSFVVLEVRRILEG